VALGDLDRDLEAAAAPVVRGRVIGLADVVTDRNH
jgi:hypothetical protein